MESGIMGARGIIGFALAAGLAAIVFADDVAAGAVLTVIVMAGLFSLSVVFRDR